jgi:Glycosyl transferase family 2
MNHAIASVVIPARDEEAVIGRCLQALLDGAAPGELEVVVVCNGCRDGTSAVVRAVDPTVKVVELPESSKVAALNAGDDVARMFPRFYVDADVELTVESVRSVAQVLTSNNVACAAPSPHFALADRKWSIRQFYDIWLRLPYLNSNVIGSGVYALSAEGRSRFHRFPALTADDQFVMQLFPSEQRRCLSQCQFTVHPPTTLGGLVQMRTRAYRGNIELAASGLAFTPPPGGAGRALLALARRPRLLPGIGIFVGVNVIARIRAFWASRGRGAAWERDESARAVAR